MGAVKETTFGYDLQLQWFSVISLCLDT